MIEETRISWPMVAGNFLFVLFFAGSALFLFSLVVAAWVGDAPLLVAVIVSVILVPAAVSVLVVGVSCVDSLDKMRVPVDEAER